MDANTGLPQERYCGLWGLLLNVLGRHICKLTPTPTKTRTSRLPAAWHHQSILKLHLCRRKRLNVCQALTVKDQRSPELLEEGSKDIVVLPLPSLRAEISAPLLPGSFPGSGVQAAFPEEGGGSWPHIGGDAGAQAGRALFPHWSRFFLLQLKFGPMYHFSQPGADIPHPPTTTLSQQ